MARPNLMVHSCYPRFSWRAGPTVFTSPSAARPYSSLAFGITYYWLIDPALVSLEIFELGSNGRYAHALAATEGTLTEIPGCDGLTLDLDALWAELVRLDQG